MEGETATWKSEDDAIATVSTEGIVTGVKAGITSIIATSEDRGVKATCKVTVKRESLILTHIRALSHRCATAWTEIHRG